MKPEKPYQRRLAVSPIGEAARRTLKRLGEAWKRRAGRGGSDQNTERKPNRENR